MTDTPITVTLPLTQNGAYILLTALGIAAATGLVYLTLHGQEAKARPNPAMDWLTALGWAMVPVWFTLLGGTLWHLWLLATTGSSFLTDSSFGLGAVIAAFLGGPFVIWGTVLKQKTVEFQKESHITERISKAVEQLGEEKTVKDIVDGETVERTVPNIEVRIGGLLSLERIAQDSTNYDKGRDHVRVMEILCAYVRENAPASGARDFPLQDWESLRDEATEEERKAHVAWRRVRFGDPMFVPRKSNAYEWTKTLSKPRADIALVLQIIGRRTAEQRRVEARWGAKASLTASWVFDIPCPKLAELSHDPTRGKGKFDAFEIELDTWTAMIRGYAGYRLDLRDTDLQGADISHRGFSGAKISGARLEGANLSWALLIGADLTGARLHGASLFGACLQGSILNQTNFEGANLRHACMHATDLSGSSMVGADLTEACAQFAMLSFANLESAELGDTKMELSLLFDTRLQAANLERVNLGNAFLLGTRIDALSNLNAAEFRGALLKEVDLSGVPFSREQIELTFGDASVTRPENVIKPEHWPDWELPLEELDSEYQEWLSSPTTYTPPKKPTA